MSNLPYALELSPDSELEFTLTRNGDQDARCTMTLHHPGTTDEHLAFKVKTTQPRRYLVRPNQGLVAPNGTEKVSIMLVQRDKQVLLQAFDRLGQPALDQSKDKFLVQSSAVSLDFAKRYGQQKAKASVQSGDAQATTLKELSDGLTAMWNTIASDGAKPVFNKKLHVRHTVKEGAANGAGAAPPRALEINQSAMENMTPEQMFAEVSSLRRKYDELVSFSVNLTAERDILNNTLEQTKRELNRELEKRRGGDTGTSSTREVVTSSGAVMAAPKTEKQSSLGTMMVQLTIVGIACFLAGVKMAQDDKVGFLSDLPVVGSMF
mmetsp:Transcript_2534/g.4327  ORF Transcript_2534/g.4327 Transcript_2534/m.4327 type:complete len:321 (-) Transcript_2534:1168-2130(-)